MSNIEEDIKTMHKIISFYKDLDIINDNGKCKEIKAIEHILAEREQDKKRIKELEDIDTANKKVIVEQCDYIQNKSIPKQKVKEILIEIQEEFNKLDKETDKQIRDKNKDYYKCKENIAIMQTLAYCRDKFEELLEEK